MFLRALAIVVGLAYYGVPLLFATPDPLRSIRVLQWKQPDGALHPACTTWATRVEALQAWVTAAHCVPLGPTEYAIDGRRATVFQWNGDLDLAALRGGPATSPLQIAYGPATALQPIMTIGFPFGHRDPHMTAGISSGQDGEGWALFGVAVGNGMSGAPVLDARSYLVVGMIQRAECEPPGWCPFSNGVTAQTLRRFLFEDPGVRAPSTHVPPVPVDLIIEDPSMAALRARETGE